MRPNSIRPRGVCFALLFGPPRSISRDEALKVHSGICDSLGLDDFVFRYTPSESSGLQGEKCFSIRTERIEGKGRYAVVVENKEVKGAIRLLIDYVWPQSVAFAMERFDSTVDGVFQALGGDWTRGLAEVRLRAQCDDKENDALGFLRRNVFRFDEVWFESLGRPLSFASFKIEVDQGKPIVGPLDNPKRELNVEILRDDPRSVYVESVSQWTQVPLKQPVERIEPGSIRRIDQRPSQYVGDAWSFLQAQVEALARLGQGKKP